MLWRPLAGCSLIVANLEAPVTERTHPAENKSYNLRTSRRALDVFDSRFVLSLANNHIMDYGPDGLADTIDALDAAGISYAGAGRDIDHARTPRFLTVSGIEAAVICAADSRFHAARAATPGTCPAFPDLLTESITSARGRARLVLVSIHMGLEYVAIPSAAQFTLAELCLKAGAQVVQFHHSHCLSGSVSDGRGRVLFGTGNYVFPKVTRYDMAESRRTAVWRLRYSKHEDAVVESAVTPASIDSAGIPYRVEGRAAERELARIRQCGERTARPVVRQVWRFLEMLGPRFMRVNIDNYCSMLRRRGPLFVCRNILAGLRAQMAR